MASAGLSGLLDAAWYISGRDQQRLLPGPERDHPRAVRLDLSSVISSSPSRIHTAT